MKSKGLYKSQFPNSLANWEKFRSATRLILKKPIFYLFNELEKNWRSPDRATFKNPKISLRIKKDLEVRPRMNIKKSPNIEPMDELKKVLS